MAGGGSPGELWGSAARAERGLCGSGEHEGTPGPAAGDTLQGTVLSEHCACPGAAHVGYVWQSTVVARAVTHSKASAQWGLAQLWEPPVVPVNGLCGAVSAAGEAAATLLGDRAATEQHPPWSPVQLSRWRGRHRCLEAALA